MLRNLDSNLICNLGSNKTRGTSNNHSSNNSSSSSNNTLIALIRTVLTHPLLLVLNILGSKIIRKIGLLEIPVLLQSLTKVQHPLHLDNLHLLAHKEPKLMLYKDHM